MKLIVWLWNIWNEYTETRHNIWFMFLDYFKDKINSSDFKLEKKFFAEVSSWMLNSEKILLAKPITYMNNSWISLSSIANFYKINPEDIYVIYDDVSMDFWKIRLRKIWRAGWHNWIKSIISHFGEEFNRVKVWVGFDNKYELSNWVLSKFSDNELIDLTSDVFPETEKKLLDIL